MVGKSNARLDLRLLAATLAVAVIGAACTGDADDLVLPVETTSSSVASTAQTDSDERTDESTTSTVGSDASPADTGSGDVEAIWLELWTAAGTIAADRDEAFDALGTSVDPEVADSLTELIAGEVERTVFNSPVFTEAADGTIRIDDCLNVRPSFIEENANWWSATAVKGDEGWVIQDLNLETAKGCVPAAIADDVIAAYNDFWDSRAAYWRPADPDHPDVARTMTGVELERLVPLLAEHEEKGWYVVVGEETRNPVVALYESSTTVVVTDCQLAHPTAGLFDADGNRLEGIDQPVPDQRDFNELVLVQEEGQWKVDHVFRNENTECDVEPVEPFVVPVVGEGIADELPAGGE